MKPLQWFLNRIGKRIYRTSNGCSCGTCQGILENGIIVGDEFHAAYLHDWEGYKSEDGSIHIRYVDTKEELL